MPLDLSDPDFLMSLYIMLSFVVALLVHGVRALDLRDLGAATEEDAATADFFERPDRGALVLLLTLIAAALAAYAGWRIPAEIERLFGGGGEFGLLWPRVMLEPLGRAAQVVGAVCFALIALRMLRLSLFLALAASLAAFGLGAFGYVFG